MRALVAYVANFVVIALCGAGVAYIYRRRPEPEPPAWAMTPPPTPPELDRAPCQCGCVALKVQRAHLVERVDVLTDLLGAEGIAVWTGLIEAGRAVLEQLDADFAEGTIGAATFGGAPHGPSLVVPESCRFCGLEWPCPLERLRLAVEYLDDASRPAGRRSTSTTGES